MPRHENTVGAGALILLCFTDMSIAKISRLTGINKRYLRILKSTAIERRFDLSVDCQIYEHLVEDSPCSSCPKEIILTWV